MTEQTIKEKLLKLVADVHVEEQTLWASLSSEERNACGEIDCWGPKDYLAHSTFWTERLVTQLQAAAGGEPPKKIDDFQETNEEVYDAYKDRNWEDVLAWATEVNDQLQSMLDSLSEEKLQDSEGPEGAGGQPLWQNVAVTGIYHPLHHVADVYLQRGDFSSAQVFMERVAEDMAMLDGGDTWQGSMQYNLACFFALHDKPRQALDILEITFKRAPTLVEWSKQDTDLDSLRELPEFQAMLNED